MSLSLLYIYIYIYIYIHTHNNCFSSYACAAHPAAQRDRQTARPPANTPTPSTATNKTMSRPMSPMHTSLRYACAWSSVSKWPGVGVGVFAGAPRQCPTPASAGGCESVYQAKILPASRRGQDKRGRRRSAAISHNQLLWKSATTHMARCDNTCENTCGNTCAPKQNLATGRGFVALSQ